MKIGLYFGTFNPIHIGHLIIANHVAENSDLDQVWMVVTPHNPLKNKQTLLDDYQRLNLVFLATEDYPKIKPSDIEFKLSQPNYTVNTLAHLQDKFPQHEFSLIMGEDNLKSLNKWKNYDVILENHDIYVYPRITSELDINQKEELAKPNSIHINNPTIHRIDAPIVEISSTFIRENIKNNKNVRPLLPEKVWEYIDHNNLYKDFNKKSL
jgi:nicotinate-nucleotide adenylyltransferase